MVIHKAEEQFRVLQTNLPIPRTSFIGREAEIAELKGILTGSRILTLIGSQGIGKSRLALRLASDVFSAFPDGAWAAELPAIPDADIVPGTVAWALNAPAPVGTSLTDALVSLLRSRRALLVLEVPESNLAACARTVATLAEACPSVTFLTSARRGLGLRDEAVYCVLPLSTSAIMGGSEAERLCRDRAAQHPDPPPLDSSTLAQMCSLLNGVPLALEIAIGGITSRPGDSFAELARAVGDLPAEQQGSWEKTLQLTLDWSYERLTEPGQRLLEHLSVFHSGWSLEAATAVCCDEFVPHYLLPTLLESLRAKSFIAAEERAGFNRERLRDAVRSYAESRLALRGENEEIQRRHVEFFFKLAGQGAVGLAGTDRQGWTAYLNREYANFRGALLCLRHEAGEGCREVRLTTALNRMLEVNGRPAEGRSLYARAAEAARSAAAQPDGYPTARARWLAAIDHCRAAGDRATEARHLDSLGRLALFESDFATAYRCYEQAVEICMEMGDELQLTRALHCLGSVARDAGDYELARTHYERAAALNRSLGNRHDEAHNLTGLARVALMNGDSTQAVERFQESLILFHELGESAWEAHNMGQILRLSLPSEPLWERSRTHVDAEK